MRRRGGLHRDAPGGPRSRTEGTVVVPFSCTFTGEIRSTSGTVTADVSWDPAGAATSDTASDASDVALTVGEEIDKVIEVWDDKTDPENPVLLERGGWSGPRAWSRRTVQR